MHKKFLPLIFFFIFSTSQSFLNARASISIILSGGVKPYLQSIEGIKAFFDEKNVSILVSQYNLEKQKQVVVFEEMLRKKPDVIFTVGTEATRLVKENIKDIPVVFSLVLSPGTFIESNVTGVLMDVPVRVKLNKVRKILPDAKRVGIIYSPESNHIYTEVSQVCKDIGIQLVAKKINSEKDLPSALADIFWQIDFLLMIPDTKIYFQPESVKYILNESLSKKLPVVGLSSFYTKAGALISFDCDYEDLGKQAGEIALRILNGEKPSDIQPIRPRAIKVSLNLITAERLGIQISPKLIKEANEVVK